MVRLIKNDIRVKRESWMGGLEFSGFWVCVYMLWCFWAYQIQNRYKGHKAL